MRRTKATIKWKRQWGGSDKIVWVNVEKFDLAWKNSKDSDYICRDAPDSLYRYQKFGEWLQMHREKAKVHMPHIALYEGGISFTDGRHRFAWCRDNGVKAMPVTVGQQREAIQIAKLFGSKSRICLLPLP